MERTTPIRPNRTLDSRLLSPSYDDRKSLKIFKICPDVIASMPHTDHNLHRLARDRRQTAYVEPQKNTVAHSIMWLRARSWNGRMQKLVRASLSTYSSSLAILVQGRGASSGMTNVITVCSLRRFWQKRRQRAAVLRMAARLSAMLGLLTTLAACATARFDYTPDSAAQDSVADSSYYFEYCAASQLRLKQLFSPDIEGGAGGHAAFYLAGACRDARAGYPVVQMCEQSTPGAEQGVGISMDGNFRNANWVATPGRSFFYDGDLAPGERLTRSGFAHMQGKAEQLGLLDGVVFRPELYAEKPAGMSDQDYRYALSVGTDYAIGVARGRYCARIPLSRAQMVEIVQVLNAKNTLYRDGKRDFHSSLFQDNCVHLPHNALAAADIWARWPTNMFLPLAILDFPVPKNDFVNLMRRTNDLPLDDLIRLYNDPPARRLVLRYGRLPNEDGALAASYPIHTPNDIFAESVALIFYDAEPFGPYPGWFHDIFHEPRYTNTRANLQYFADLYAGLTATRRPLSFWEPRVSVRDRPSFATFYARYYERLATLSLDIADRLLALERQKE